MSNNNRADRWNPKFNVRMEPASKDRLHRIAKQMNVSASEIAREAIAKHLDQIEFS